MKSVVKKPPPFRIAPLRGMADRRWAARLMAESEPWRTLGRGAPENLALLRNRRKTAFVVRFRRECAGVLVLDEGGPLGGYLQVVCVAPECRNHGLGERMVRWAERRLFRAHRNVFLCVSSFNRAAQRFYRRLGYVTAGRLRDYVVAGHDELLLRKTLGPLSPSRSKPPRIT